VILSDRSRQVETEVWTRLSALENSLVERTRRLTALEMTIEERSRRLAALEMTVKERTARLLAVERHTVRRPAWRRVGSAVRRWIRGR
jgi:hypothetical protein